MKSRKNQGSVFIQAIVFFITITILVSVTGELNRGWKIISELNNAADIVAASVVSNKSLTTYNEQLTFAQNILQNEFTYITNPSEQLTIAWLNENDGNITISDPDQELPLYENTVLSPADPDDPAYLLSKLKITITYPPSDLPDSLKFPNSFIRSIIGDLVLSGTGERLYKKKASAKHFILLVRTKNIQGGTTLEYRPICAADPVAQKTFWDRMCIVAARTTEQNYANSYLSDGITSGATGVGATIASPSLRDTNTANPNSEISTVDYVAETTTFTRLATYSNCDADGSSNRPIVNAVACYPSDDGSYTAPAVDDIRYIIIDENTNSGEPRVFIDPSNACPEVGTSTCCTYGCNTLP